MRRIKGVPLAIAAVLVIAACGDDDDDDAADTATTVGDTATTAGGAATTSASPDTTGVATTAGGTTTPGTGTTGDCTLDEPLTIGYAADFSEVGGFADVPGSEAAQVQVDLLNARAASAARTSSSS